MYSEWCLLKLNEQGSQDWSQWMINELISWIGRAAKKRLLLEQTTCGWLTGLIELIVVLLIINELKQMPLI